MADGVAEGAGERGEAAVDGDLAASGGELGVGEGGGCCASCGSPSARCWRLPAGAPDIAHDKGVPGRAQLYIDGRLVGETDMPVTTPIAVNPGGMACGASPGFANSHQRRQLGRRCGRISPARVGHSAAP
ncbi:hypothetical protein ACIQOV_31775, partial [Kitasatospora sp. NPDC091257]|uniref:hypothetical protein n=1 Tax=Kitasatospora sp. NPDC091257 TaxID=3364084 RepID=UPI0037F40DDE